MTPEMEHVNDVNHAILTFLYNGGYLRIDVDFEFMLLDLNRFIMEHLEGVQEGKSERMKKSLH